MRFRTRPLPITLLLTLALAGSWTATLAASSTRHSGTVLKVEPQAEMLVLEEMGVAGKIRQLGVNVPAQARVVLSERLPADQVTDLQKPFKETTIGLSDIRPGDFVTVELDGKKVSSVTVTFRGSSR